MGVVEYELAGIEPRDSAVERLDIRAAAGGLEGLENSCLVPFSLEAPDAPGAGVRHRFVVEVDGILSGQQHADEKNIQKIASYLFNSFGFNYFLS